MDMRVSGSGSIPGGVYDDVRISGSGRCQGDIKCKSFRGSGSSHCTGSLECEGDLHVSGSGHMEGNVKANEIHCSGSLHAGGSLEAMAELHASGSCHVEKDCISHGTLHASGSLSVEGGIEAEKAMVSGKLHCKGLLNAEQVEMKLGSRNPSKVGAIGGSQIVVEYGNDTHRGGVRIFGLWIGSAKAAQEKGIILKVAESIEGDVLNLEGVETPLVVGKDVRIGDGCRIGTVRYSGVLEVSENAAVENKEFIG
ncbi:MAG: polymer-forming cytoskeletal protein [Clostridia bacterium]|nr:polymer-forming cytoskeletal protein [Clostridia bacterium]